MLQLVFSGDMASQLMSGMAIVILCGLSYATLMTLYKMCIRDRLIVADHGLFQAQKVQQLHGHTGVLGGNKVCRAKGGRYARRHIVQIADRCV